MDQVNANAELIDGEYYISVDSLNEEAHARMIKSEITTIEEKIAVDDDLTNEEKQNLINYTTSMMMNIDHVVDFTIAQDGEYLNNGRVEGLFSSIGNLFSNAVTAVTTVVVTAVTTITGVVVGAVTGGVPGAIIGGLVGFSVGIEFSFYLSCVWGLDPSICSACQAAYPSANIIC